MTGTKSRTSCTFPFKKLKNLPVPCQYTFSKINFIVNNQTIFF